MKVKMLEKEYEGKNSTRYCLCCDEFTTFEYDWKIIHSVCENCGNQYGVNKDNNVLKHFLKKIEKLDPSETTKDQHIKKLQKKVRLMKKIIKNMKERRGR